jgi:hypothetical protein
MVKRSGEGLGLDDAVRRAPRTAETPLDEEIVVLLIDKGDCFGLNVSAAQIWRLIGEAPVRLTEVRDQLTSAFDVAPSVCERELLALMDELRREGLVIAEPANPTSTGRRSAR